MFHGDGEIFNLDNVSGDDDNNDDENDNNGDSDDDYNPANNSNPADPTNCPHKHDMAMIS